ncbi:PaaI family thioesterase [Virgibacillus byunsanensis]|uniref:PaaI family thioesterase n=1 Tax=Virgibacillus byunsanensis TaxID=570945 RepID=A0ABW3LGC2_9BACI
MNDASVTKQKAIDAITNKLSTLRGDELEHIRHVLDTIVEARNDSMHYLGKFLGISEVDNGFMMELGKQNENTYGVAQGGAIYTLADVAIGFSILNQLQGEEKVFTQELKVNFIKKGEGEFLYAKPSVLHFGKRTVVADCSIKDVNGQLIAQALGTFHVTRARKEDIDEGDYV